MKLATKTTIEAMIIFAAIYIAGSIETLLCSDGSASCPDLFLLHYLLPINIFGAIASAILNLALYALVGFLIGLLLEFLHEPAKKQKK